MIEIQFPPLADRKEDLPLLQRHFLKHFSTKYSKELRGISRRAQILLTRHPWPGNVRQLENRQDRTRASMEANATRFPGLFQRCSRAD
jgi:DNA-binding NtrC family response regulator